MKPFSRKAKAPSTSAATLPEEDVVSNSPHTTSVQATDYEKIILLIASSGIGGPQKAKELCEWAAEQHEENGWGAKKIADEALRRLTKLEAESDNCTIMVAIVEPKERH
jgi:hypothetical protein